jgi:hypothetical protein
MKGLLTPPGPSDKSERALFSHTRKGGNALNLFRLLAVNITLFKTDFGDFREPARTEPLRSGGGWGESV